MFLLKPIRSCCRYSTKNLVGARGFEPRTPCAQGRCATRLRYAPTFYLFDSKLLPRAMQRTSHVNRGKTVTKPQAGRKPWQNTRVSNISELRSETTETKLVKTEFGRA